MTDKETEKYWYKRIKECSKTKNWKFKSFFIFKVEAGLFYVTYFHVNLISKSIEGTLEFKPVDLDDLFWKIIKEKANTKMPLSFRAEAAFQVTMKQLHKFNKPIPDVNHPDKEIIEILEEIEKEILSNNKLVVNLTSFIEGIESVDSLSVSLITSYVKNKEFGKAKTKIEDNRNRGIRPKYTFGKDDFFDLVLNYIRKENYRQQWLKFITPLKRGNVF